MAADQADMNCHPARTGLKPKEAEEIQMTCKIIEEVKEEERAEFAGCLLIESDWSIEKIARIANFPVEEVQQLQSAQIASTGNHPAEAADQ